METDYFHKMSAQIEFIKAQQALLPPSRGTLPVELPHNFILVQRGYEKTEQEHIQERIRRACHCIDLMIGLAGVLVMALLVWGVICVK